MMVDLLAADYKKDTPTTLTIRSYYKKQMDIDIDFRKKREWRS